MVNLVVESDSPQRRCDPSGVKLLLTNLLIRNFDTTSGGSCEGD